MTLSPFAYVALIYEVVYIKANCAAELIGWFYGELLSFLDGDSFALISMHHINYTWMLLPNWLYSPGD